jgi:RHH-type transcriptional regulator, proline utilization regulon repressor / proline dehydrogenase / delta 1-pyrroline-5-carboxylate dehydrogenase
MNENIIKESVLLAESWQNRANKLLTKEEKAIQAQILSLLTNPMDKVVITKMIDQSFRFHNSDRVADQINNLLRTHGVPDFFSRVEKLLVQMFLGLGRHFPYFTIPLRVPPEVHAEIAAIAAAAGKSLNQCVTDMLEQAIHANYKGVKSVLDFLLIQYD